MDRDREKKNSGKVLFFNYFWTN